MSQLPQRIDLAGAALLKRDSFLIRNRHMDLRHHHVIRGMDIDVALYAMDDWLG